MSNERYCQFYERSPAAVLEDDGTYVAVDFERDSVAFDEYYGSEETPVSSMSVLWQSEAGVEEAMKREFTHLADAWEHETQFLSSVSDIITHRAHLQIVAMGPDVVPLILDRMQRKPGLWFDALCLLTRQDPVTEDIRGDIDAMTEAWLEWGRRNGYF